MLGLLVSPCCNKKKKIDASRNLENFSILEKNFPNTLLPCDHVLRGNILIVVNYNWPVNNSR